MKRLLLSGVLAVYCCLFCGNIEGAGMNYKEAILAGGCFWCVESAFEKVPGVKEAVSGYTGGDVKDPSYKQVSSDTTGHREAVKIIYDPSKVSYKQLLNVFWRQINPTDEGGQFNDRGFQYTTAIFYLDDEQKKIAEKSKQELDKSGRYDRPIATEIIKASEFYPAEEYHQDYYKKSALQYNFYRFASGRDGYLKKIWGNEPKQPTKPNNPMNQTSGKKYSIPPKEKLKKILTPLQYRVTQEEGTERAFSNEYWDNKKEGIYVDIVSGEPLFISKDKYKSGTGWPSFTKPLEPDNIVEKKDRKLFMTRTEVRSKHAGSHLGHVFDDGPPPTGLRYCINSAALRFVPKEDLKKEGYAEYESLF